MGMLCTCLVGTFGGRRMEEGGKGFGERGERWEGGRKGSILAGLILLGVRTWRKPSVRRGTVRGCHNEESLKMPQSMEAFEGGVVQQT